MVVNIHKLDERLLQCYRHWLWAKIQRDRVYCQLVLETHGKTLGCFCKKPDGSGFCHGDILERAAKYLAKKQVVEGLFG